MSEINIKIKLNKGGEIIKELNILSDMKIEDLRIVIEEEFKIPPHKQNLIFKGRMLQNEKKLEDYNITNNDMILLIEKIGEQSEKTGLNNISGKSGVGTPGLINYDLLKQPMGFNGNVNDVIEAMKIPEIAGQVESMFDDPNVLEAMMQNPQMKAICDLNPGMKDLFTNKEFLKNMLKPENLEMMKNLQEGNVSAMNSLPNLFNFGNNNNNSGNNNGFGFNFFNPMMNPMMMSPMMNPMMNPMMGIGQNNFFSQGNSNMTKEQLKEKYKNEIKAVKDMGFDDEDKILNALQKTNGNINASIERLINNLN